VEVAAFFEEDAAEIEVALLAGGPVEPDQRQFDFLVPADLAWAGGSGLYGSTVR
jgi:hypothetical protein